MASIFDTRCDALWASDNPGALEERIKMLRDNPFANEPGYQAGMRRLLQARREHDTWDRLDQIRCPVLICGGQYDGIALPVSQERMASLLAQGKATALTAAIAGTPA